MINSFQYILDQVEQVFLNNPQVSSVDNGRELEFDIKKTELFPRVFLKVLSSDYKGRWEYNFEIMVMGLVDSEMKDRIDTMNRCHAICVDGISWLKNQQLINPQQATLVPIYNYQDIQTSGWMISVKVFSELGLDCYE